MLKANTTYLLNGVTVQEKIIPDGTIWKNAAKAQKAGFLAGALYKKQEMICGNGKPQFITIHNTADGANVKDDAELYTRATYNENMGSARVHFYVDDTGAWQNLKAGTGLCPNDPEGYAEVGWHAGDGSTSDGGNMTSLSIEIIMGESADHDSKAKDNGARIAAWLLHKHGLGIDKLVTHTYWVNKSASNKFSDVDEQCCNPVYGKKWCPSYIFCGNDKATAMKNWKAFKSLVERYMKSLDAPKKEKAVSGEIDGIDRNRGTDELILYVRGTNGRTNANKWGYEVAIDKNGVATSNPVYGVGNMAIPKDGYVLSGHGAAGKWLSEHIKKGTKVSLSVRE